MAMTPEQAADTILRIIVSKGTKGNEIIMKADAKTAFLEQLTGSSAEEFNQGLSQAVKKGWLKDEDTKIRLTAEGYKTVT